MLPTGSVTEHPDNVALPDTVEVLGVPLAITDYDEMLDLIDAFVEHDERGYVCVCNVHSVMASEEDPELRRALIGASVNVPDGQPLVWAMNALGQSLDDRVYGPELMWRSCARAAATGQRIYLYGGRNQQALLRLSHSLRAAHPGLQIVGGFSPPFRPLRTAEREAVVEAINSTQPDVVWIGIGAPKQEKWMASMRPALDAPMMLGVGAAFDFHAGLVPQAPPALQDRGLEWAFRLVQEPRRLWRRYLRYNPRFLVAFARQLSRHRRGVVDKWVSPGRSGETD
jgi:N-acetylglucosaminyldiphosphoundecaprenol N-acetyl-beta-D-mannosaminyltransferase